MSTLDGNAGEKWVSAEFVVALPHLSTVRAELAALAHPVEMSEEQDEVLGLALIRIGNIDEVTDRINKRFGSGDREGEYPIDRVIRAIRENCRARNGGWVPTMGKNRTLDGVHAAQHVGVGGDGYPEWWPATEFVVDGSVDWVNVGLLDTSLWPHRQLNGRYVTDEPRVLLPPADSHPYLSGHATFVAGLILQHAPNAHLHVRSVLDDTDGTALAWDVARELVRLAKSVKVINLSFCCFTADNEPPLVLARAIERISPETVIVAAAGNHGDLGQGDGDLVPVSPRSPMWPAAFDQVVAVGAHDDQGRRAYFSPDAEWVDLTARGVDVGSIYIDGVVRFGDRFGTTAPSDTKFDGCAKWRGTSFAAAAVSGAVARRIGPGTTARAALNEVLQLPAGNPEGIWRYRSAGVHADSRGGDRR